MRNFFLKSLILLITRSSILVGGQAVINGVMMRAPGGYSTSVRLKNGTIRSNPVSFNSLNETRGYGKIPIIRGVIGLYEAFKIGFGTLNWSADIFEEEGGYDNHKQDNPNIFRRFLNFLDNIFNKFEKILNPVITLIAILIPISLFMYLPYFLTSLFIDDGQSTLGFNAVGGIIRIFIFLTYLILSSQTKIMRTLFQYHGAEHKTIATFENGESLSFENTQKHKKEHPRCGTSFVFIVMLIGIFIFSIIDSIIIFSLNLKGLPILWRILIHISCLPIVSGFSYEILKFLAKYMEKNYFVKLLCTPGLLLQKITTKEPDKDQLEVAFESLKTAFGDSYEEVKGNKYKADAIG